MGDTVFINEVGPRDGLQNQPVKLSVEQRVRLIERLLAAGLPGIEVGSFVSPKAVPQMAETDRVFQALPKDKNCLYTVLVPNMRGYEMARDNGVEAVSVPLSATDEMNQKNLNMSTDQLCGVTEQMLRAAQKDGIRVVVYISVAFHCPFAGKVPFDTVIDLCRRMRKAGCRDLVIADTIGAAGPRDVRRLMGALCSEFEAEHLSAHFHDTRALAIANASAAMDAGIRRFDASIGGLGGCPFAPGAAGNVATEDLLLLCNQMGLDAGLDFLKLLDCVKLAREFLGEQVGGRTLPFLLGRMEKNAPLPGLE